MIYLGMLFLLVACDMEKYPEPAGNKLPEILIYCDIAMLQPLKELAAVIESAHNCKIVIISSNSDHLVRTIEINHQGDLFFPGCSSYLSPLLTNGIVTKMMAVGYNEAGFLVWPGNPKQIPASFASLVDENYRIAIASPMVGSIGRDTKRALEKENIYRAVVDNALFTASDSQELSAAIIRKDVDLVVNWRSVKYLPGNSEKMEFLSFPPEHKFRHQLIMGKLLYSKHPKIVSSLMDLAISKNGKNIFKKYGFGNY